MGNISENNLQEFNGLFWKSLQNKAPTISFIIFLDFLMLYQIFLSPQVKRWAIITDKHGI